MKSWILHRNHVAILKPVSRQSQSFGVDLGFYVCNHFVPFTATWGHLEDFDGFSCIVLGSHSTLKHPSMRVMVDDCAVTTTFHWKEQKWPLNDENRWCSRHNELKINFGKVVRLDVQYSGGLGCTARRHDHMVEKKREEKEENRWAMSLYRRLRPMTVSSVS